MENISEETIAFILFIAIGFFGFIITIIDEYGHLIPRLIPKNFYLIKPDYLKQNKDNVV